MCGSCAGPGPSGADAAASSTQAVKPPTVRKKKPAFMRRISGDNRPITLSELYCDVRSPAEYALFHKLYPQFVKGSRVDYTGMSIAWNTEVSMFWEQNGDFGDLFLKAEAHLKKYERELMKGVCVQMAEASVSALDHVQGGSGSHLGAAQMQQHGSAMWSANPTHTTMPAPATNACSCHKCIRWMQT